MISKLYGTGALDRIIDIKRWRKSSRAVGNTDCAILSDLDGCSTPNPSLMRAWPCA